MYSYVAKAFRGTNETTIQLVYVYRQPFRSVFLPMKVVHTWVCLQMAHAPPCACSVRLKVLCILLKLKLLLTMAIPASYCSNTLLHCHQVQNETSKCKMGPVWVRARFLDCTVWSAIHPSKIQDSHSWLLGCKVKSGFGEAVLPYYLVHCFTYQLRT